MNHTMKVWERIIETRLRESGDQQTAIWIYARKGNHRCHVCSKNVDGKEQERSKRATLCICGPREGLRQGSTGRAVVGYCMRKSGIVKKYVQLVQDMYEGSETMVRKLTCAILLCPWERHFTALSPAWWS